MPDFAGPGLSKEEEFFAKKEFERIKKIAEENEKKLREQEKEELKQMHWMRCPKDGMELAEIVFMGVHVDKCTHCGGIFLDAGELDVLMDAGKGQDGMLGKILGVFR